MTNKGQMKDYFRKINQEIARHYFYVERNNQRIYELQSDWSIHPSDKLFELDKLTRKNFLMKKEIQRLKDEKIILSCG